MPTRHVAFALLVISSTGCTSLLTSDSPPDNVYWLEARHSAPQPVGDDEPVSITVRVSAAPGLDTDRVLIRGPGAILTSYAGARWIDNAPDVFDTLIRSALEDSRRFSKVASDRSSGPADWTLDLELRAFYAVMVSESSPPTIEVELRGYLQDDRSDLPIRISGQATASQSTLTAIVAAFQNAVDECLAELLEGFPEVHTRN